MPESESYKSECQLTIPHLLIVFDPLEIRKSFFLGCLRLGEVGYCKQLTFISAFQVSLICFFFFCKLKENLGLEPRHLNVGFYHNS